VVPTSPTHAGQRAIGRYVPDTWLDLRFLAAVVVSGVGRSWSAGERIVVAERRPGGDTAWRCRVVIPAKCWRRCL